MSLRTLALSVALALIGCSSTTPPPVDVPADSGGGTDVFVDDGGQRFIPDDVLARQGMGYSGYRKYQSPATLDYPTEAQIKEDMQILLRGGWSFIRLFDCSKHAELVLKVIRDN